eukprot:GHVS01002630.1.p1 GENE.GHVS01002630.1~~GHVS01002630.1.p1  ORF type:complete len:226 (+),score=9.27 GHVS01002630.1:282-959(+)
MLQLRSGTKDAVLLFRFDFTCKAEPIVPLCMCDRHLQDISQASSDTGDQLKSLWCTFDQDKNVISSTPRGNDVKLFEWHYPWKPVGPSFLNFPMKKGSKHPYMYLFNCAEVINTEKKELVPNPQLSTFAYSAADLCDQLYETGRLQYQDKPVIDVEMLSVRTFLKGTNSDDDVNSFNVTVVMKGSFQLFFPDRKEAVGIHEMRVNMVPTKSRKFAPTKATLFRKY